MAVNFRRLVIQVIWKFEPLVQIPLVIVIESLLALILVSFQSKNVYPPVHVLPALVVAMVLLLFVDSKMLIILYSCCICVSVFIGIMMFFSTAVQNLIVEPENKLQTYYGFCFYLAILGMSEHRPLLLTILAFFSFLLRTYKYYWIIGLMLYGLGQISGIHRFAREYIFTNVVNVFQSVRVLNATVHFYKARQISAVLRVYWLLVFCSKFLFVGDVQFGLKYFLVSVGTSCNSSIRLFGMSLWIPQLSYVVLWITRGFLHWTIHHTASDLEPRDLSKALAFCVISYLNGVTGTEIHKRIVLLSIFMFISFSLIFQSAVELTDGVLKSLSTSLQNRYTCHARALMTMLTLLWCILYSSYKFCTFFPFYLWQLIAISSNIVTVIQVLSSLAVYALFIKDSQTSGITDLDDWIYYITAFSNTFELFSAFLVLSFGLWNVVRGGWSVVSLLIIFLHTYCNIWLKAGDAWKIFVARRAAAVKLGFLANATKEELEEREDLCPICFDSMAEAKVTQCGHFFHSNCLRKWLYIRATCPLCHQDVLVNKVKED